MEEEADDEDIFGIVDEEDDDYDDDEYNEVVEDIGESSRITEMSETPS